MIRGNHVLLSTNYPVESMFTWRNEPEIFKWCRQTTLLNYDDHVKWVKGLSGNSKEKMYVVEEICDQGRPQPIGVCGFTNIDWIARHAEFSLYIQVFAQKRGFGKEALALLLGHGFSEFGFNKIWGESFVGNPAIKMFASLGMKITPGHREHYFKGGKMVDTVFASMTFNEYFPNVL